MATTADDWSIYWRVPVAYGYDPVGDDYHKIAVSDTGLVRVNAAEVEAILETYARGFPLTVPFFQEGTATGNTLVPENLNDGNTGTIFTMYSAGDYCDIAFSYLARVTQYRYYGNVDNDPLNNKLKIRHWEDGAWVDNTVDIPDRGASWSNWTPLTTPISTTKIRWEATAMGAAVTKIKTAELEMKM